MTDPEKIDPDDLENLFQDILDEPSRFQTELAAITEKVEQHRRALQNFSLDGIFYLADIPAMNQEQLTQQLKFLPQQLPPAIPIVGNITNKDELIAQGKERVNSDAFLKAAIWLEALFNQAPTTCGFDFYLMQEFRRAFAYGVPHDTPNILSQLLHPSLTEQRSIFNPLLVREIESTHFHGAVKKYTTISKMFDDAMERVGDTFQQQSENQFEEAGIDISQYSDEEIQATIQQADRALQAKKETTSGRTWVPRLFRVYDKGPLLKKEGSSHEILERWHNDFVAKYKEEP